MQTKGFIVKTIISSFSLSGSPVSLRRLHVNRSRAICNHDRPLTNHLPAAVAWWLEAGVEYKEQLKTDDTISMSDFGHKSLMPETRPNSCFDFKVIMQTLKAVCSWNLSSVRWHLVFPKVSISTDSFTSQILDQLTKTDLASSVIVYFYTNI